MLNQATGQPVTVRLEITANPPIFDKGFFSGLTCVSDVAGSYRAGGQVVLMLKPLSVEGARAFASFFQRAGFTYDAFRHNINLREIPSKRAGNIGFLLEVTREPSRHQLSAALVLYRRPGRKRRRGRDRSRS